MGRCDTFIDDACGLLGGCQAQHGGKEMVFRTELSQGLDCCVCDCLQQALHGNLVVADAAELVIDGSQA